jgi:hypothetical protein
MDGRIARFYGLLLPSRALPSLHMCSSDTQSPSLFAIPVGLCHCSPLRKATIKKAQQALNELDALQLLKA